MPSHFCCVFLEKFKKMKLLPCLLIVFSIIGNSFAQNLPPVIQSLQAATSNLDVLTITYQLTDNENDDVEITFRLSDDNGKTYSVNTSNATGDVGFPVSPGISKEIIWNYSDLDLAGGDYLVMLVADDQFEIDIQEIVDQVDSNRLRSDLEFIEGIRHRTAGSIHLQEVKDSIESHFSAYNLENENSSWVWNGYTANNYVGRKPGLINDAATYIIDGHFDTVINSPGADDNGSAVAGVMEALRVLAPYNVNKTIKFIGFDLEEDGGFDSGSFTYVDDGGIPEYEIVKGVFNFEMIGYYSNSPNSQTLPNGFDILYPDAYNAVANDNFRGNFITNVGIHYAPELIESFDNAATEYVPELRVVSVAAPQGWLVLTPDLGRSDHAAFWLSDLPALMLTDGANFRNPNYHSPNDTIGALNFTFMSNVVKATVAAVAELAEVQHSTFEITDVVIPVFTNNIFDCEFSIFPNPNDQFIQLSFEECGYENVRVSLQDLNGKIVHEGVVETLSSSYKIPTNLLPTGMYILHFQNKNKRISKKVIVNH
jgi:Zn-dependent M28 family amino/carboxypeptidase